MWTAPLGSIITFRYLSPTAHDRIPTVLVLAQNHKGLLHGINVRYLTPMLQQQLQWYFLQPQQKQTTTDPFDYAKRKYIKDLQDYEKRKMELLEKQTGVIVKPAQKSPFGVSTFQKTQLQQQPANQQLTPQEQQQLQQPAPEAPKAIVPPQLPQMGSPFHQQGQPPSDPFQFYHRVIKPLMGRDAQNVYRTYKHIYIKNPRFIKSVRRFRG